jgi:protein-L-isoaspartate(D-aspartate) O-methyltransferase
VMDSSAVNGVMPGGADEARLTELRQALVAKMQERGSLADPRVAAAFAAMPRHLFLPDVAPERVYSDQAITTKEQGGVSLSSSSQPSMMAIMIQQSLLEPGQRILEIGAGAGYNAAILRYLTGPTGQVTTIDVDADIVAGARAGLTRAGYGDVRVILGDGGYGWAEGAPYDRIIVTVGASDLPSAWVEQLRPDGLLTVPLALGAGEFSAALRKLPGGLLMSESLDPCSFVRLRGAFVGAERIVQHGEWTVIVEETPRLQPNLALLLLDMPLDEVWLPAEVGNAAFFLSFCDMPVARLWRASGPDVPEADRWRFGFLDTAAQSGCILSGSLLRDRHGGEVRAWLYGSQAVYDWLLVQLEHWRALGRPGVADTRIFVYPRNGPVAPPTPFRISKPTSTLILTRRNGRPFSIASR